MNEGKKKHTLFKIVGALVIALVFAVGPSMAQLIVYDPQVDGTLKLNFAKTIADLYNQLQQLRYTQAYWEVINGHWYNPLAVADLVLSRAAALGLPINNLGWGADQYHGLPATQAAAQAADQLQSIMQGHTDPGTLSNMHSDIESSFGTAPVTTDGIKVDFAYRTMAQSMGNIGQNYQAIQEIQKNIKDLNDQIRSGDLPPADIERMKAEIEAQNQDLKALEINQQNENLQLQTAQLGIIAGQEADYVNSRLQSRYDTLSMFGGMQFSTEIDNGDEQTAEAGEE
jgi:hypothetical protein